MEQATQQSQRARSNKLKLIWGLISLIGPTALFVLSILIYAIVNFIAASIGADSFSTDVPLWKTIANVVLFLIGAVSVITWLPGIIVGIILLATRK